MTTVLITGANRGIGLELVRRYAAAGNDVLACCREPAGAKALNALADKHKKVRVHGVRVADAASVEALKSEIGARPIDVLINNAGMQGPAPQRQSLAQMDFDGWAETFAVNSMAPLRMLQAFRSNLSAAKNPKTALSGARERGKAITITSQMGALSLDMTMAYAYCASKAAVNKVMRLASVELKKEGISVALVHPGWVKTDMGGPHAQLTAEESAKGIVEVIDALTLDDTGCFRKWNGETHAW